MTFLMPEPVPEAPTNWSLTAPAKVGVLARKAPLAGKLTDEIGDERSM
ncbi:MAG: hypothetical protein M0D55_01615 [Elusimicrobiota bacterium]|nr:MAG: hypothetical protein M0D55_01615 [Elusimicrobiota bacterium]